ncbi:MFS transporter [Ferrimonas sp. SCSIO 43195]|uniref:MFS transporter n=1 Tax=Ferrimonas sp. SCSIO 43195 TaxID=2822844 RepID=UPI002075A027|nr:MFS transporter [Ferrimonas sp. SCSIO 43195]
MAGSVVSQGRYGVRVPVGGLFLFAIAAGYLMSLLPLSLPMLEMESSMAAWLASAFYAGLLFGALWIEPIVRVLGHRRALVLFLLIVAATVALMIALPSQWLWLGLRVVAGAATAGVFVVVESWLLLVEDERQRASRLGLYMAALYGGNALGQLLMSQFGVSGMLPFLLVLALLVLAALPPLLGRHCSPLVQQHHQLPLSSLGKLKRSAVLGCMISGLILGPMYGLLPVYLSHYASAGELTGMMMAVLIFAGMAIQPLTGWLSARMSKTLLLALLSSLGTLAVVVLVLASTPLELALAMLLLGMSAFALYPVAISQACDGMDRSKIVSITQLMLLSYSMGSVLGPVLVNWRGAGVAQLPSYLGGVFMATALYMLVSALSKTRTDVVEPPAGLE